MSRALVVVPYGFLLAVAACDHLYSDSQDCYRSGGSWVDDGCGGADCKLREQSPSPPFSTPSCDDLDASCGEGGPDARPGADAESDRSSISNGAETDGAADGDADLEGGEE